MQTKTKAFLLNCRDSTQNHFCDLPKMRVSLKKNDDDSGQVSVMFSAVDDPNETLKPSHTFPLEKCEKDRSITVEIFSKTPPNTVTMQLRKYGKKLFNALFPEDSKAREQLQKLFHPVGRIFLELNGDEDLDNIPWEYAWAGKEYLVRQIMFTRVLKGEMPELPKLPLRIVVVAPDPVNSYEVGLADLHLNDQFQNFIDKHQSNGRQVMLDRVFPPTVDKMDASLTQKRDTATVLHFMGHCAADEDGSRALVFENSENGKFEIVDTTRLVSIPENLRLAFLSACDTREVARIMARQGVPYTIGSNCSLPDDIARKFEAKFYQFLADGSAIDKAMWRTRAAFVDHNDYRQRDYLAGAIILYSCTSRKDEGLFQCDEGEPRVNLNMPPNNLELITTMSRFRGRRKELVDLYMTMSRMVSHGKKDNRVFTITGIGGQGKTALAVEVVNRTAHFFPGGIFAWQFDDSVEISATEYLWSLVEALLSKAVQDELRLQNGGNDVKRLGQAILKKFHRSSCLLILDHADTLKRAEARGEKDAIALVAWLKEITWRPNIAVKILATSYENLEWPGEEQISLSGLLDSDINSGCELFVQNLTADARNNLKRQENENTGQLLCDLVTRVHGHPLSLVRLAHATSQLENFDKSLEDIVRGHYITMLADDNHKSKTLEIRFKPMIDFLPIQQRLLLYICSLFGGPIKKEKIIEVSEFVDYDTPSAERPKAPSSHEIDSGIQQLYLRGLLLKDSHSEYGRHVAVWEVVQQLTTVFKLRINKASNGQTLLHRAAERGYVKITKLLVVEDVNAKDNEGLTPLHLAAKNGHVEMVKFLVSKLSADINAKTNYSTTPLHLAVTNGHIEIVRLLVGEFGADANPRDKHNATPLHIAASGGFVEIVKSLVVDFDADVNAEDSSGDVPLVRAAKGGHIKLVEVFLTEFKTKITTKAVNVNKLLHLAVENGHVEMVKSLVNTFGADSNTKDKNGRSPLHWAAHAGHVDVVKLLLNELHADANAKDEEDWTALHLAAQNGHVEVVKSLVNGFGVDLNAKTMSGLTVLQVAVQNGSVDVVKLLVGELGVDTDVEEKDGSRPLHWAAQNGHIEVMRLFVKEFGADINATTKNGLTPLHMVALAGHANMMEPMVGELGANINAQTSSGLTILHAAAQNGHVEMTRLLASVFSANTNAKDGDGLTPLHMAAQNGHLEVVNLLVGEFGANINAKAERDLTPLHWASQNGHVDVVETLVRNFGADVDAETKDGLTSVYLAGQQGHVLDVAKKLMDLGATK